MANALLNDFQPTEHTLLEILDHYARLRPDAIFAEYPHSPSTYSQGYRKITYLDLANAVNGAAKWLIDNIGIGDGSTKLAYIGPNDVRYSVLTLAAIKAGYSMFFPSPRNSVRVQHELLHHLRCKAILSPTPRPSQIIEILEAEDIHVLDIPETADFLDKAYPAFPFQRSLEEVLSEPLLTIHTSGSTRLPKPMTFTHDTARKGMKMHCLDAPDGYEGLNQLYYGKRVFLVLPPFHGACLASLLLNALPFNTVMIAPLSAAIPSAAGMVEGIKQSQANVAIIPPSILEELVEEPDLLQYCAQNLDCMIYCGGDLPPQVGDMVASKVPLYNQYGSTELGLIPMILSKVYRRSEDWKYVEFHPDLGLHFRLAMDDQYELCMVHQNSVEAQQLVFTYPGFTNASEYATGDLFERHSSPEKSALWTWCGRRDDIVVLTNGEKINPIEMEHRIMSQSRVITGALVTGSQHFQPILLLEPKEGEADSDPMEHNALLEGVWPIIQEVNQVMPAYAHIEKSHVFFTHAGKPMRRSAKGTIQRAATIQLYQQELEAHYAAIAIDTSIEEGHGILHPDQMSSHDAVAEFIRQAIKGITGWNSLDESDDLYVRGMDSQQTLSVVRNLRRALPGTSLTPATMYTNPSVGSLTKAVINNGRDNDEMIDQIPLAEPSHSRPERQIILLTHSVNGVGPYILDTLLKHPSVAHIYCLSKVEDGRAQQINTNRIRNLKAKLDPLNVTFLNADLSQKELGLSPDIFESLQRSITMIIHSEWAINLVWSFSSFEPHLRGLVNLLEFCAVSNTRPHLFWVSSIAGPLVMHGDPATLPEQTVQRTLPSINGYGESRYVGERILQYAHERLGLHISIARLTYTPGPIESPSVWSPNDWLSGLIAASLQIGSLPDSLGQRCSHVDWVPMDLLSHVLVDLAMVDIHDDEKETGQAVDSVTSALHVFHPVNLHPITWPTVHDIIIDEIQRITTWRLESVTLQQWLQRIQAEHDSQVLCSDHVHNPDSDGNADAIDPPSRPQKLSGVHSAMRMQEFYRYVFATDVIHGLPATKKTAKSSSVLRSIPAVQDEWVRKWVREWVEAFS
ncbi:putative NRPS-like protein biosynthetic cluster [Aspergillus brasiliensis]|uniref:NRPS-like protein biosynthetic cluster n=1 Tax=Aspergillus brasiliensis TaxID=319629 RepID=A0A9W5YZI2_9EURO|nr:putative NRPS-like protein biosynthetic cluster [Aspergillus brasiliensis]GKZ50682.1 putative NRPS-like protein biosynthetic cluster [Aspergillus brasiliensis]